MRVSKIFALAAATAVLGIGVPGMAATAANAATTTTATTTATASSDWGYEGTWGPYWSWNHKAKAKGWIDVEYYDHEENKVKVGGTLYDKDHRSSKCAYVSFRYEEWGAEHGDWKYISYKTCGWNKKFYFARHDVPKVEVSVCQINKWGGSPYKCGHWEEIYDAYDAEYGYED